MKKTTITFITGNEKKLAEVTAMFPQVVGFSIDLPEIQSVDLEPIVAAKLHAALQQCEPPLMVDDTALYLDCLRGDQSISELPGPFIKWFLEGMGNQGIVEMTNKLGNARARAHTMIGYAHDRTNFYFFEGIVHGAIVMPISDRSFGWDYIFKPEGYDATFAEMDVVSKNSISPRAQAVYKLKSFLGYE